MAKTLAAQLEQFKAALEADVSGTLAGYAAEHAEVVQLWREFAAAMAGGFPKPAEPAPMVAPPPPAQPTEEVDAAELVLAYLAGHPEGAKLVDLASTFGLARPQMGKLLRHLVDSGQVVKDPETLVYKLAEGNPL
jgi:biotin carboxyl carrier protein